MESTVSKPVQNQ